MMTLTKRCLALAAAFLLLLTLHVAAEKPEYYSETLLPDGSRIVYTHRSDPIATPHGGLVYLYDQCGVIGPDGTFLVEPIYKSIEAPVEGRALFSLSGSATDAAGPNNLWGYFDEDWNIVIEPAYTSAQNFTKEGLAGVTNQLGAGYIDRDGNVAIPFDYSEVRAFTDGFAEVYIVEEGYYFHQFHRKGRIDQEGNVIEPVIFRFEEDSFDVVMSENLVEVGGIQYDNSDLSYPFINYLGYSYIPLTYGTCRAMGIACNWSEETGLVLSVGSEVSVPEQGGNTMQSGVYGQASLYSGTITIEGKTYDSGDFYYPLLSYRDIVYLPVLYREGMERLGINYSFFRDDTQYDPANRGCMIFTRP